MLRWAILVLGCSALLSCSIAKTDFPVKQEAQQKSTEELGVQVDIVMLDADNIDTFNLRRAVNGGPTTLPSGRSWNYRVGVGDILDIVAWDHPELTLPAGEGRSPIESGFRVQADGTFFYPYVGQVSAAGFSTETIRQNLTIKLSEFIPDPQLQVRVVGYNSQYVSVTGEVTNPSRLPLTDAPLSLLQAVDAAGGLTDKANARQVTVRRGERVFHVDLQKFLDAGRSDNNPLLNNGDVVNVPELEQKEAFLLGQIVSPSTIDLTRESANLTQALTRVGGLREDTADARGVFVFRDTENGITVYQLDASTPVAFLLGTRFDIRPQDVIYVTTAPVSKWNALVNNLLPSVAAYRAVDTL